MTLSTFPISFEAGLIVQSDLPIISAFFIVDNASASGSNNIKITYVYFSKPIWYAVSLKHCLQRYNPYFLTSPCFLPHRLQALAPAPNFLLLRSIKITSTPYFSLTKEITSSFFNLWSWDTLCFSIFLDFILYPALFRATLISIP